MIFGSLNILKNSATKEINSLNIYFKCDGINQVFTKMVDLVLPFVQTLTRIIVGWSWEFTCKIINELIDLLAYGWRWLCVDATFKR